MLRWFQAVMPKEDRFFDMFVRHSRIVVAGAEALRGVLQGGDKVPFYCQQIVEREAEADEVTREVITAVRRSFITPFDRSDIQDLIGSLDDAIDQMNKTAKTITLFEVNTFTPHMQQMGDAIADGAKLVAEVMPLLSALSKNAPRINVLTESIIAIEERADQLYDLGRKAMFMAHRDGDAAAHAMDFIVGSQIYDSLEKVVDRLEDVSNEVNALVVDHL